MKTRRTAIVLAIGIILSSLMGCYHEKTFIDHILDYCENNQTFKFSLITEFDWDIAYVDRQAYGKGEDLKKKYGLDYDFEILETDYWYRIVFCNDRSVVRETIFSTVSILLHDSVEVINPDSVFNIEWKDGSERPVLYLSVAD